MKRRDFLRCGSAAAGTALFGLHRFPHHLYASETKKTAQDLVTLGKTGIQVTRLAQGTGTNGVEQELQPDSHDGRSGAGGAARARRGQRRPLLGPRRSVRQPPAREARAARPSRATRSSSSPRPTRRRRRRCGPTSIASASEIGTDRLDIVLLHCMLERRTGRRRRPARCTCSRRPSRRASSARTASRATISGAMKMAAASDWVDVDLARLNPAGIADGRGPGDDRLRPSHDEATRGRASSA